MIDNIEYQLLQQRKIRLENTLRDRGEETLEQFIRNFLTDYNENKKTIYVDNKEVQCGVGRRRSIDDIFLICHYYYACTLKDVAMILFVTLPESMEQYRSCYCGTIGKRVFYHDGRRRHIWNKHQKDQFDLSWGDWLNELGIETQVPEENPAREIRIDANEYMRRAEAEYDEHRRRIERLHRQLFEQ